MGEGFKKLKRWYLLDAILKASLLGVSIALLIIATFLIVIDLGWLDFGAGYSVLIGVCSGLLLGLVLFFILRKGDKRLAKKLDARLGLKEKVQTMHAFRGETGGITELQREDAQAILENTGIKSFGFGKSWAIFILVAIVVLAYFVTSLAMFLQQDPVIDDPNDPPQSDVTPPSGSGSGDEGGNDDIYEGPTAHQKKELEELIEYVGESQLVESAKELIIKDLTELLNGLDTYTTVSELNSHVVSVIIGTRDTVNSVNTTYAYSTSAKEDAPNSVKALCYALYKIDADKVAVAIDDMRKELLYRINEETKEEELRKGEVDAVKFDITAVKTALLALLEESRLSEGAALYSLTSTLIGAFDSALKKNNIVFIAAELEPVMKDTFKSGIMEVLPQERANEDVKTYVIDELMRIFDITPSDLGEEDSGNKEEVQEPEGKPPETEEDGSYGEGGNQFKSKDKVIDPESDETNIDNIKVEYGEIIARYLSKVNEGIKEGKYSEELAALLQEYYEILTSPPTE